MLIADWVRLTSLPRPPDDLHAGRWRAGCLEPSVSAAHAEIRTVAADRRLVSGWLRWPKTQELDVLVGGAPRYPFLMGDGATVVAVLFPPGAVGDRTDAAAPGGDVAGDDGRGSPANAAAPRPSSAVRSARMMAERVMAGSGAVWVTYGPGYLDLICLGQQVASSSARTVPC